MVTKRNGPQPKPAVDRVLARVVVDETTGCWLFQGALTGGGYGQVGVGSAVDGTRRLTQTHRVVYEAMVGPIPAGLDLDHLCRVRSCCRPEHLEPVTRQENARRGLGGQNNGQRAKTHCPKGHPYSGENTRITNTGCRSCRSCERVRALAGYYRRKGAS